VGSALAADVVAIAAAVAVVDLAPVAAAVAVDVATRVGKPHFPVPGRFIGPRLNIGVALAIF
jgi:hypothetical protein